MANIYGPELNNLSITKYIPRVDTDTESRVSSQHNKIRILVNESGLLVFILKKEGGLCRTVSVKCIYLVIYNSLACKLE